MAKPSRPPDRPANTAGVHIRIEKGGYVPFYQYHAQQPPTGHSGTTTAPRTEEVTRHGR